MINKDMWTGRKLLIFKVQKLQNDLPIFREPPSCIARASCAHLRANVFGGVLDTRQIKRQYGGSCGRVRSQSSCSVVEFSSHFWPR